MPDEATGVTGAPETAPDPPATPTPQMRPVVRRVLLAHDCSIPYERNEHWNSFFAEIARRIIVALQPETLLDAGC
ncbi:MAG: hypothetical protein U0W40_07680 [Acidimicrobiia bacterium]